MNGQEKFENDVKLDCDDDVNYQVVAAAAKIDQILR